jgi:RNA polymerase sigma factor (sigma-70 family)
MTGWAAACFALEEPTFDRVWSLETQGWACFDLHRRLEWMPVMPSRSDPGRRSDAELVDDCSRGDAHAWRELVKRYGRLVHGIPRAMGLQPADADDVFQQTFAELLRHLGRLRDPSRLEPWLVTATWRAALRLKRERRRFVPMTPNHEAAAPDVDAVERLRESERVRRALEALAEPCHALLLGLFADPPRPYAVMARELGLAVGSLGPTRRRCLERLRRQLRSGRQTSIGSRS